MNIDELYLESEADIKNSMYVDAFRKCESILYEDPRHAPAHNSLGWLFKTQFDDYERAENHFVTAIKSDPLYPHPYFHYATFLTDLERYDDLDRHLQKCMTVVTLEKSWIYGKQAIRQELQMNIPAAIRQYELAILCCVNDDKIKTYQEDIDRCKMKMDILNREEEEKESN
ncbi:MAG: hypothetical protein JWQ27_1446 [Ferruginibacter sp.]|nr:hypothetical protein [Ferruginibacter sp.]